MSPTASQEHALIPLKYSMLEKLEKPLKFDVGLSSNSWHASEFMVVSENLIGQRYVSWICLMFSGFLDPYNSPMKCNGRILILNKTHKNNDQTFTFK